MSFVQEEETPGDVLQLEEQSEEQALENLPESHHEEQMQQQQLDSSAEPYDMLEVRARHSS